MSPWAGRITAILSLGLGVSANAAITSISQNASDLTKLDAIPPAVAPVPFGDGVFLYRDRGHVARSAAFDETGTLSTTGTNIVGLPSYLIGHQYIENANDNRSVAGYTLTITTDTPSYVYLLLDTRLNGTLLNTSSPATTDPDLSGPLAWLTSWTRMNTGISPNGLPDYAAVDEGKIVTNPDDRLPPDQTGNAGLNQFYAIYRSETVDNVIEVGPQAIGGSNMFTVVVAPIPEPTCIALLAFSGIGLLLRRRR